MLTLAPAGGGGWVQPPLRFFADSEKTATRSAAKFAIAVQPTIWHISKKTTNRWPQRSRDQVAVSDLTSSCVFRSLTSCQRHTSDPNSLKLTMYSRSVGVYNLYISDFYIGDLRSCQFRDLPIGAFHDRSTKKSWNNTLPLRFWLNFI